MSADRITNDADIIDVRDVIERVEELRSAAEDIYLERNTGEEEIPDDFTPADTLAEEDVEELATLEALLSELKGNGGNEQWEGDWYPITLIRDDHFEDYARQLAEDIGAIPSDYSWPASHIDWEAAADALLMDYTSVEIDGVTYWFR